MLIYLGGLIGKVDYECTALTNWATGPWNLLGITPILKFIQVNFTNDRLYFAKILDTNFAFVGKSVGKNFIFYS